MPRKGPATKRQLVTDPVYGSPLVTALANKVLRQGKRSLAERIVYGALEGCREKNGNDPVVTLKRALDNVKPAAGSAAQPTRYRWRCAPRAAPRWRCAGS
jgi:small subunit ribosomal protein S7